MMLEKVILPNQVVARFHRSRVQAIYAGGDSFSEAVDRLLAEGEELTEAEREYIRKHKDQTEAQFRTKMLTLKTRSMK